MVWATVGSSTLIGWKRRSRAASFSRCLRYSSSVVAPMVCSSPRASIGLRIEAASMAPSAAPAPDEGVDLVDEQDDVAAGADLLEHLLQALLEVAPVAAAGDEGAEVEGVELLALERVGDVVGHDLLGQALDDGGLADAGLADEHRVVLGAAAEHLHDARSISRTRPMTGSSFFSRASCVRLRPNWSSTSEPPGRARRSEPAPGRRRPRRRPPRRPAAGPGSPTAAG